MGLPQLAYFPEEVPLSTWPSSGKGTTYVRESVSLLDSDGVTRGTSGLGSLNDQKYKWMPRNLGIQPLGAVAQRPFTVLQQWEGKVLSLSEEDFSAILTDKTDSNRIEEEVLIDLEEISPDDRALVRIGALFYWAIGYEDAPGIPRQRVSRIRFQRLPGWTRREVDRAKLMAKQFESLFG